jgi:hypothetical protein
LFSIQIDINVEGDAPQFLVWISADVFDPEFTNRDDYPDFDLIGPLLDGIAKHGFIDSNRLDRRCATAVERLIATLQAALASYEVVDCQ